MMTKIEETKLIDYDPEWKYRINDNKEDNFRRWWRWNTDEKKRLPIKPYNEEEARLVFDEIIFPRLDEGNYE